MYGLFFRPPTPAPPITKFPKQIKNKNKETIPISFKFHNILQDLNEIKLKPNPNLPEGAEPVEVVHTVIVVEDDKGGGGAGTRGKHVVLVPWCAREVPLDLCGRRHESEAHAGELTVVPSSCSAGGNSNPTGTTSFTSSHSSFTFTSTHVLSQRRRRRVLHGGDQ